MQITTSLGSRTWQIAIRKNTCMWVWIKVKEDLEDLDSKIQQEALDLFHYSNGTCDNTPIEPIMDYSKKDQEFNAKVKRKMH